MSPPCFRQQRKQGATPSRQRRERCSFSHEHLIGVKVIEAGLVGTVESIEQVMMHTQAHKLGQVAQGFDLQIIRRKDLPNTTFAVAGVLAS
jgi:hypothetical protein